MNYTVVGIFDDKAEARQAIEELVNGGFVRENIDLSEANYAGGGSAASGTSTSNQNAGDSIGNFFGNLFGSDDPQARSYTDVARDADAILTVQAESEERARQVANIFDRNGAIDVENRSAQYSQQQQQSSGTNNEARSAVDTQQNVTGASVIPVIEEQLQVGKREVEHGGVRVHSRVVEKPVEEHLRLREERVVVNRRPVNREVTDADTANFKEGDFIITERAEEAVVSKQARVVEEVEIGKRIEEHDQVIRETVRRTDVDVEEINSDTTTSGTINNADDTARGAGR